ncbi:MAG TPA: tRNA (adenosine(37)-N6)-threonylcarbamoyltransferase complex ATPase subunit type 1 TsaE [Candidatus Saccharimonadales bacterium]|nr:tRNA (adenosine(37)-N6)-threonylcarbamoyltransferase complex ATPase subunit type 1 TsaE [Candidatus Saccharimonadales bacterium]
MKIEVKNEDETKTLGRSIGSSLSGGEIIELIGDVGTGKTTLVKGIAIGLGIDEYIQSPSFTINRVYVGRDDITLSHYDFYRLDDAGIMANELQEVIGNPNVVTIIEWGGVVEGVLPVDRMTIQITAPGETSREFVITSGGEVSQKLEGKIKK